jgi:hypothetical protein
MNICLRCTRQVCREVPADLAALLAEARHHLAEAVLVPPNLLGRRNLACGDVVWVVAEDPRACGFWWRSAPRLPRPARRTLPLR